MSPGKVTETAALFPSGDSPGPTISLRLRAVVEGATAAAPAAAVATKTAETAYGAREPGRSTERCDDLSRRGGSREKILPAAL